MGVRAIRAKVECDRETLLALWRTHRVFNERLPSLIGKVFAMRRGELGATAEQRALNQRIARFVLARDAKDAVYLLHSVSIKGWKPATALKMKAKVSGASGKIEEVRGESWAHEAALYSSRGLLAYDKEAERDGLPDSVFQPLVRDAAAYISGHDELVRVWEREHADWLVKKAEWESKEEHRRYLALRPRFEAFEESVGGRAGKRRERWHLYLTWLRENPDLAAWRGGPAVICALDAKAKARIARARPWKQRSVEADEFWKANRELAALHRLHGAYEGEFIRRRKAKKNPDGFDHRPTFTMPDPVLHPRWALFNAPQTSPQGYGALQLPDSSGFGSLRLRLLTGERTAEGWPNTWLTVRFRADPRLAQFRRSRVRTTFAKGKMKGEEKTKESYVFVDRQLGGMERPAAISGVKLIFRFRNVNRLRTLLRSGDAALVEKSLPHLVVPYLVFACTIDDLPLSERAKAAKSEPVEGEADKPAKRWKRRIPAGLVTCAVDLGVRHLGFMTLARVDDPKRGTIRVLRARNQWLGSDEPGGRHPGRWSAGPDLAHIGEHKREIRRLRRLRGKPVKGEESHVELQDHITHMGEDRFKKAARAIVNFALNVEHRANTRTGEVHPRADALILERLAGFIPDAERERGINRALVNWNRGQLVTRIKEVAKDAGLKVFEVHPAGTSQCCSKCGSVGRRYSIVRDDVSGAPVIRFGWVERLFACPNPSCPGRSAERPERPFTCNADHNASVNLHRRLVLEEKAVEAFFAWKAKSDAVREREIRSIDDALRPILERLHALPETGVATPF